MHENIKTKFKETEIGPIPEDWIFEALEKHAEIIMGQSPESEFYNQTGDGILFMQGIRTFGEKFPTFDTWTTKITKLAKAGSVLLSVRAPVGEVNIATHDLCIGRGLMALNGENNEFLFQLLKAFEEYIVGKESGTVYGSVTKDDIAKIELPFPPLAEQTRIAEILSSLDDKIELNRQINANLEKIASALFKRWFVDFEFPFDFAQDRPDENGKPYKSSGGKMIESELGEIPEGWRVGKLSDIANIAIGRTPPRLQEQWFSENPKDVKWISIRDLGNSGIYVDKTAEFLTREAIEKFNIPIIPKNTVILSFKLTVGRLAITSEEMLSNEAIAHIKLSDANISTEYIYLALKKFDYSSLGSTSSIATAVNSKSIKDIPLLIPDGKVVTVFTESIAPIFQSIFENTRQLDSLIEIRDSLLPRLMSGKIRAGI